MSKYLVSNFWDNQLHIHKNIKTIAEILCNLEFAKQVSQEGQITQESNPPRTSAVPPGVDPGPNDLASTISLFDLTTLHGHSS